MAVTRDYQKYLPSGCDLLDAPAETLVEAQAEFCACEGSTCFFGPVLESPFSAGWREQWNAGACFRGKAIIGSGYHELVGLTQKEGFLERAEQVAFDLFGKNGALAAEKQKELVREGTDPLEGWERVFSDFMYRFYSDHFAKTLEQEGNDIWVYSFDYPPARHGQGFFFLQGQVEMPGEELAEEKVAEARKISDFFRARVREFILNDEPDPNLWPRYQGGNKMVFDVNSHMQYRPSDTLEGFPERVFCR